MLSRLSLVLLLILAVSQENYAQWRIEHPETIQNSHYHLASPPGSEQVFLFGNDLLQVDLNTKDWAAITAYDLQKNFKNELSVSPTPDVYSGVHFVSESTGFMVYRQEILRTLDGGKSWDVVKSLTPNPAERASSAFFTDLYFPSPEVGYAVGTFEKIFKTEDGGQNWEEIRWNPSTAPYHRLSEVVFKNEKDGFVLGYEVEDIALNIGEYKNFILRTEDGGESWEKSNIIPGNGISDHHYAKLSITPNSTLYLALINRNYILPQDKLFRSIDHGQTWKEITLPGIFFPGLVIYDMHWFSAAEGMILGTTSSLFAGRQVFRTTNGGEDWTPVDLPVWPNLGAQGNYALSVAFEGERGVIAGAGGSVIFTDDKGVNWESLVFPYPQIKDISMVTAEQGFAIGENGLLLKKTGANWDTLSPPVASHAYIDDFDRLAFADAHRGVLLGASKDVYKTTNQAESWEQLLFNGDTTALDVAYHANSLYVLCMIDRERLVLLERRDGAAQWSGELIANQSPKGFYKGQLQVISDELIFASHDDVLFQRIPTNGSWSQINTAAVGNFEDRFFFEDHNFGYLSTGDKIWISSNGGQSWDQAEFEGDFELSGPMQINGFATLGQDQIIAIGKIYPTAQTLARDVCLVSRDKGYHWDLLPIPFNQESALNGVVAWNTVGDQLWLGSTNGVIFQYQAEGTTPVTEPPSSSSLQVFPNPSSDHLRIKALDLSFSSWRIFNSSGKEVSALVQAETNGLDISSLPPGAYVLQVFTAGELVNGRFIKQ
ncbi:MAG: T9SS type A sorting domain-containing protein [Saprospiraceae bacterium]|nr:T9SS type A sorting domain-containing protein [Saprospiraceae bacterium]